MRDANTSLTRSVAIIIPIFNEEDSIESTLTRIFRVTQNIAGWQIKVICVNDGSTDKSALKIQAFPHVTPINHSTNQGYGAALKTGIDASKEGWVCILDADGTYPIENLNHFFTQIENLPSISMVVGERKGIGIIKNPIRRLARWVLKKIVLALTGIRVRDLNSGMRLFKKELFLQCSHLIPNGFSFTTTLTVASLYMGYEIKYIPIEYSIRLGKSSIRPVRDFINFLILITRLSTYFEPLTFFIPISLLCFLLGSIRSIRDIIVSQHIGSLALLLIISSIHIFIMGVLADVIARHSRYLQHVNKRKNE
ncbi:MAG TPA: glycosyltransferase family 2 protein [Bdellovibrionota bacterium]|nr:glycosyltransferase family 2 protein [Bdellovibrionota bacterium]